MWLVGSCEAISGELKGGKEIESNRHRAMHEAWMGGGREGTREGVLLPGRRDVCMACMVAKSWARGPWRASMRWKTTRREERSAR